MKKTLCATVLVGALASTAGMADQLSVQLDPGVHLAKLVHQGNPHRPTEVKLMVRKKFGHGKMSAYKSMPLRYVNNGVVRGMNLPSLQGLNEPAGGIPIYQLSLDIHDATSSTSYLHCGKALRHVKFVPGVDYVMHIHSLHDDDCSIQEVR